MKILLGFGLFSISLFAYADSKQLLILSGGGYPYSNHYSQYLQTKTVYSDLSQRLSYDVNVFFGAGNNTAQNAELADVHKTEKKAGLTYNKYIVGAIENNNAATKKNVFEYFQSDIKPDLETFFMIVSDHGTPNRIDGKQDMTFSNNCIDLWNTKLENNNLSEIGSFEETRCLSKNELKSLLTKYVPAKRKVFAMSQCFSGGFHQMSVDETGAYPKADPNICGFTAITQDTYASGCSPDVDGPTYQGYERSFTEQLTGFDYANNRRLRAPKDSLYEAHQAAILEDMTVDIPLATSDYYLWRWALKITDHKFVSRSNEDVTLAKEKFDQAANFNLKINSRNFKTKKSSFLKMKEAIQLKFPEIAKVLDLPINDLKENLEIVAKEITTIENNLEKLGERSTQLYYNVVYRFWLNSLDQLTTLLNSEEMELEKNLQEYEANYNTSASNALNNNILPIMWAQNPTNAEFHAIYLSQRVQKVSNYALTNGTPEVITKTKNMEQLDQQITMLSSKYDKLQKYQGLMRRMFIYRQVLGAWAALDTLKDKTALSEVNQLIDCERTKL